MVLYQLESGYCFNSDTIFLYDFIMRFSPKGKVLDVGAGCGVLGLLVAKDAKNITLSGVEKQEIMAKYIQKNALENGIEYKLYQQDFLTLQEDQKYDFIISNPPFYHNGVQKSTDEITHQARYNEHLPIKPFIQKVKKLLQPRGHFIFCYDQSQLPLLCSAIEAEKMKVEDVRFVHPKKEKNATLVMLHVRNGSKSYMKVHPPLIAFDTEEFSKEAQAIYKKANTESIKCKI